ncbi:hypothetical protein ACIBI3_44110 [Actinomadura luteofluorescens]|uniref:hypothetical protein n=1 Tax=Actinomadura luteofluorescens TaxID=46163 RepID=UPI00349B00ED
MPNCARTVRTGAAFGAAGALFGALALAVALGVWADDPTAFATVPGAWYPVITGAISGFVGAFMAGPVGIRINPGAAAFALFLAGGYGLMFACLETVDDNVLHYYTVDFGVALLSIGITTMIGSIIAAVRRRRR